MSSGTYCTSASLEEASRNEWTEIGRKAIILSVHGRIQSSQEGAKFFVLDTKNKSTLLRPPRSTHRGQNNQDEQQEAETGAQ